jgi:membrane-bound ClpP family serine protease
MDIYLVLAVIILGILLVVLEILVVPGTTVVGVIGGALMGTGVVLAYSTQEDPMIGHYTLAGTSVATVILLYWAYKVLRSKKYSLYDVIDSQVNVLEEGQVKVGDEGVTLGSLRPEGKALINDKRFAVFSQGEMIDVNTQIEVIKINGNKIIVKPLTD